MYLAYVINFWPGYCTLFLFLRKAPTVEPEILVSTQFGDLAILARMAKLKLPIAKIHAMQLSG